MGIPITLYALFMIYADIKAIINDSPALFPVRDIIPVFMLGYALLLAKDTLIEGLTLGLFKIKKND
jgi:hypothetical protein